MTNQKCDQAALNGLVDDCYDGKWPWEIWDLFIAETWSGYVGTIFAFVDNKPIAFYVKVTDHPDFADAPTEFKGGVPIGSKPLAGTWVEGRLRELIGEAFLRMEYFDREETPWWEIHYYVDDYIDPLRIARAPTVIQALVAALRVLKQKEVSGE